MLPCHGSQSNSHKIVRSHSARIQVIHLRLRLLGIRGRLSREFPESDSERRARRERPWHIYAIRKREVEEEFVDKRSVKNVKTDLMGKHRGTYTFGDILHLGY
jgi:hypothetical protein